MKAKCLGWAEILEPCLEPRPLQMLGRFGKIRQCPARCLVHSEHLIRDDSNSDHNIVTVSFSLSTKGNIAALPAPRPAGRLREITHAKALWGLALPCGGEGLILRPPPAPTQMWDMSRCPPAAPPTPGRMAPNAQCRCCLPSCTCLADGPMGRGEGKAEAGAPGSQVSGVGVTGDPQNQLGVGLG